MDKWSRVSDFQILARKCHRRQNERKRPFPVERTFKNDIQKGTYVPITCAVIICQRMESCSVEMST